MGVLYKYKNDGNTLVWTLYEKDGTRYKESLTKDIKLRYIDKYKLKISLDWISELGGSPTAIQIQATHDKDNTDLEGSIFLYNKIWAHYKEVNIENLEITPSFCGIDTKHDFELCLYSLNSSTNYASVYENISKDDVIEIELERIYSGVITFNITPIMSYGKLDNLTLTIRIDLNKIASGEILLNTWNYRILETEVKVEYENDLKKEVTTTTTIGLEENASKTVITETKVIDPIISKTDIVYTLSLKYGLESYKFDNLKVNNSTDCYINFYDLETLPIDNSIKDLTSLEKVEAILENPEAIPTHVEIVPVSILSGGQITVNFELNSSYCNLKPNKAYLCLLNILTINDNGVLFLTRDYRYLYTSGIYNDYVDLVQDFKNLYLPIVPELSLLFYDNHIQELYFDKNSVKLHENPFKNLEWFKNNSSSYKKEITFLSTINNRPEKLNFTYDDKAFTCNCSIDFNPTDYQLYLQEISNVSKLSGNTAITITPDINNSIVLDSTIAVDNDSKSKVIVKYDVNLEYEPVNDTIELYAIKSNLLNTPIITENSKNASVFLAERAGLENTIIMSNDLIPAIGLSNSNGSDEEWYLEGTFLSEGFIHDGDTPYDDSQEGNDGLALDLTEYGKPLTEQSQESSDNYSAKKYYLYYGSRNYSESLSEKDPTIRLNDLMTMDDLRDKFNTDFNNKAIAPMLFLTHGQTTTDSKAGAHIVTLNISNDTYLSQPHRANSDDKHAFDSTEPYLYPFWYTPKQILGTFLIKYADTKGGKQFVLTSNYFTMDFFEGRSIMYSRNNIKSPDGIRYLPNTHYIEDSQIPENKIPIIVHKHQTISTLDDLDQSNSAKFFTIGDLYATQLAQFAVITPYTTPKPYVVEDSVWFKLHGDLTTVKNFPIHNLRSYSFTFNDDNKKAIELINKYIQCGRASLYEWNNFLPSNNLEFNPIESYKLELTEEKLNLESNKKLLEYEKTTIEERLQEISSDSEEAESLNNLLAEIQTALENNPYYTFIVNRILEINSNQNYEYPVVTFADNQDFSPLGDVLPDTSKFMLEINPDGSTTINFMPKDLNVNTLFYWTGTEYKVYNQYKGSIKLYKYGKFTKNICIDLTQFKSAKDVNTVNTNALIKYFEDNRLNINNYNIIEGYNEIDSDLLCFHPIKPFDDDRHNFIEVEMPLKYNQSDGVYTTKKSGKKQTSGTYRELSGNSAPIKGLPYYPVKNNTEYLYESMTRL